MKSLQPLVTVLMPVYNAERYLREAVDSILNQTFEDFEFLIMDDGSTDSSAAIIESYNDPRIRFIQNDENLGIVTTLNKGIELASCEFIARMDSDDISRPERLEKQYRYFQENPDCALVSGWIRSFDTKTGKSKTKELKSEYFYYFLTFNTWIMHPTVMYRRSAVMSVGMYSNSCAEDFSLWSKLIRRYKIHNISEVLLDYRLSETSLSRVAKRAENDNAHLEQMIENIRYYTSNKFPVSKLEAQFLRGTVKPFLKVAKKRDVITCFRKLDYITLCILKEENVNRVCDNVRNAAKEKKKMLINSLRKHSSKQQFYLLLLRLKYQELMKPLTSATFL